MTRPSEANHHLLGRDGEVGPDPVARRWRSLLRWLIVVAFVSRAALSVLEAESVADSGMRTLSFVSSATIGAATPVWPLLWGGLALVTAAALALRIRLGWLLGVAVAVAYLVAGISDLSALTESRPDVAGALGTVIVGLGAPLLMLAGLLTIRVWYVPSERGFLHPLTPSRFRQATPPALHRWRVRP